MKKIILNLILLLPVLTLSAQIKFEEGDFKSALEKATKEDKLIFIDCYTSWCGPCKQLAKIVFPDTIVGNYMNKNFVNYKSDMEKGEGIELRQRYGVNTFPTLLILKSNGEVLNRVIGMKADPNYFISQIQYLAEITNSIEYKKEEYLKDFNKANDYLNTLKKASMDKELNIALIEIFNKRKPKERYSETNFEIYKNNIKFVQDSASIIIIKDKTNFIKQKSEKEYTEFINNLNLNSIQAIYMNNIKGVSLEECNKLIKLSESYPSIKNSPIFLFFIESYNYACKRDISNLLSICSKHFPLADKQTQEAIKRFAYRLSITSGKKEDFERFYNDMNPFVK